MKLHHRAKNLLGRRFGNLKVVELLPPERRTSWLVRCKCGNEKRMTGSDLLKAEARQNKIACSQSCPYSGTRDPVSHGLSHHPIYHIHDTMMARCYRPKNVSFQHYGGRGLVVCERWHDREKFFEDMLPTYRKGLQLDREDNEGDYCPENCRWTTPRRNSLNKRQTLYMNTPWGRMTVIEAAGKAGVNYTTVLYRISKGVPEDQLLAKADVRNRFMTSSTVAHGTASP